MQSPHLETCIFSYIICMRSYIDQTWTCQYKVPLIFSERWEQDIHQRTTQVFLKRHVNAVGDAKKFVGDRHELRFLMQQVVVGDEHKSTKEQICVDTMKMLISVSKTLETCSF